jgi:hypothetical protein
MDTLIEVTILNASGPPFSAQHDHQRIAPTPRKVKRGIGDLTFRRTKSGNRRRTFGEKHHAHYGGVATFAHQSSAPGLDLLCGQLAADRYASTGAHRQGNSGSAGGRMVRHDTRRVPANRLAGSVSLSAIIRCTSLDLVDCHHCVLRKPTRFDPPAPRTRQGERVASPYCPRSSDLICVLTFFIFNLP